MQAREVFLQRLAQIYQIVHLFYGCLLLFGLFLLLLFFCYSFIVHGQDFTQLWYQFCILLVVLSLVVLTKLKCWFMKASSNHLGCGVAVSWMLATLQTLMTNICDEMCFQSLKVKFPSNFCIFKNFSLSLSMPLNSNFCDFNWTLLNRFANFFKNYFQLNFFAQISHQSRLFSFVSFGKKLIFIKIFSQINFYLFISPIFKQFFAVNNSLQFF